MSVVETVARFTAAWLAVGLGLFVLSGSLRVLRPTPAAVLFAVPSIVGMVMILWGLLEFVRVVPW